jgi:integrase
MSTLVERSFNIDEAKRFSQAMNYIYPKAQWGYNTVKCTLCYLKKILRDTAINPSFITRITIYNNHSKAGVSHHAFLTKKINSLNDEDISKIEFINWANTIKIKSLNKSVESMRVIMYFYINSVVPALKIDMYNLDLDSIVVDKDRIKSILTNKTKISRMKLFMKCILGCDTEMIKSTLGGISPPSKLAINDDGSDKHTFTPDELDLIYNEVIKNNKNKLIYLLLITTGMRVGGLVKIKIDDVATITDNKIDIKRTGRTIEKGNKWFSFVINDSTKQMLYQYIESERISNSVYLFPSKKSNTHVTTASIRYMIKVVAKKAGVEGVHVHPHSLRHSYAHILLDCGNDASVVSKLLGHADVSTTQAFYLKENAIDVADKANIPWLDKSTIAKRKIIPDFLNIYRNGVDMKEKKEKRRNKNMKKLNMFLSPSNTVSV